jgi:hypothetical protein
MDRRPFEFPGPEFPARVAHSSRIFDSASGTMRMELLLENQDLPASRARLHLTLVRLRKHSLCLPTRLSPARAGP